MPDPYHAHVTCPTCGKSYRWQPSAAGRKFPCKQCGEQFTVPSAPGIGISDKPQPQDESAQTYELADYDDEPVAEHARFKPAPKAEQKEDHDTSRSAAAPKPQPASDPGPTESKEEPRELSEAARATRREQQRIAAATSEPVRTWRDYKTLITLAVILGVVILIVLGMYTLSDVLNGS